MNDKEFVISDKEALKDGGSYGEAEVEEQMPLKAEIGDGSEVNCDSETKYQDEVSTGIVESPVCEKSGMKDTKDELRIDASCKTESIDIEVDNGIEVKEKVAEGHVRSPHTLTAPPLAGEKTPKRDDFNADQMESSCDNSKTSRNEMCSSRSSSRTKVLLSLFINQQFVYISFNLHIFIQFSSFHFEFTTYYSVRITKQTIQNTDLNRRNEKYSTRM